MILDLKNRHINFFPGGRRTGLLKIRIYWRRTDWTIFLSVRFRPSISPILPEALMKLETVDQGLSSIGVQGEGESFEGHNEPYSGEDPVFFIGANFFMVLIA